MVLVTAGALAAHALLDERQRVGDALAQVVLLPRILGGAHLVRAHRVVDVAKADALAVGELRDVGERDQRQAVGELRERLARTSLLRPASPSLVAGEELAEQARRGQRASRKSGRPTVEHAHARRVERRATTAGPARG